MKKGFTLVELAIVLVIIGLLVGGVLQGQELIKQAQIRGVIKEFDNFKTSLATFKLKYNAVPGDMANAVSYWGAQAGGTADGVDGTCSTLDNSTPSTTAATCNGDGNGQIGEGSGTNYHEWFRAWQHLQNAGFIAGNFTGVPGAAGIYDSVPGENDPESKYSGGTWHLRWGGDWNAGDSDTFVAKYGNVLFFGAYTSGDMPWNPVINAGDASSIDTKLDDGKPQSGKVMTNKSSYRPNCVNGTDDGYLTTDSTKGCNLWFISGF